jgi:c-di-GMP-binding flagellar brake protein YcgR
MFERTSSLWRRLTGRTPSTPPSASTEEAERRAWVRYPSTAETQFTPVGEDNQTSLTARVRDVSLGGIKLLVGRPFDTGSMLTVVLTGEGQSSLSVLACVVHCREQAGGEWALGCSFAAELEESDLEAFGARKARSDPGDGRHWARYPCQVRALCQLAVEPEQPAWPAQVLNISANGMALQAGCELPTGTLLSADLTSGNGPGALTILACVVHVTVQPDGKRVTGCNFIRELSESDLKTLL